LFAGCSTGRFPLLPLLRRAIASQRLYGQVFEGAWNDVGSVERLAALQ
jgi:MurNAc alpha-1-phosphate uridylyltransferase